MKQNHSSHPLKFIFTIASCIAALLFCFIVISPMTLNATQGSGSPHADFDLDIGGWTETTPLPQALASRTAVVLGDYLYVIGGRNSTGGASSTVYRAQITPLGTLSNWEVDSPLPAGRYLHAVAATDSSIFVVGGWTGDDVESQVWRADVQQNGQLSPWRVVGAYPLKIDLHATVIVGNRLYSIGGFDGAKGASQENVDLVYSTDISGDTLGPWVAEPALPVPLRRHAAAAYDGRIYVTGGSLDGGTDTSAVHYTEINADGSLGPWQVGSSLPATRYYHGAVIYQGRLVVLGGKQDDSTELSSVLSAPIQADGAIGSWTAEPSLPLPLQRFAFVPITRYGSSYLMVIGGRSGGSERAKAYHSSLPSTPTPTPFPTPTNTPTPTPGLTLQLSHEPQGWIAPAEEVTYTVNYVTDESQLSDVTIVGTVPEGSELISDSVQISTSGAVSFTQTAAGSQISWQLGELPAESQGELVYSVRRLPIKPGGTQFVLSITARGPSTSPPGEMIDYDLLLVNHSILNFTDLIVRSDIPTGAEYVASSGDESAFVGADGDLYWSIDELPPEGTIALSYSVTAERSIVLNDYQVTTSEGPFVTGSNLVVTKVDGDEQEVVGDDFVLINDGVQATWQMDGEAGSIQSNGVRNPQFKRLMLPLILR